MRSKARWLLLALLVATGTMASVRPAAAVDDGATPSWATKIHPLVASRTSGDGTTEFLVVLEEQADLSSARDLRDKAARGRAVHELLEDTARRTQAPLLARLDELGAESRPFWIANMIWVRGDRAAVEAMASRADVLRIDANPRLRGREPRPGPSDPMSPAAGNGVEWGVEKVRADDVWALGYDGTGVVVAGQDSGYEWDHPALVSSYRGSSGLGVSHDYHWHDAIHSGGGSCGADSPFPCDDSDHGTHTMGTMVGDDGNGNRVGVAPGARWIGCRNMDEYDGTAATYSECFEWFVAPTDLAGNNPDPSKAPHVINNSWYCPPSEGCSLSTLQTVVENTRAAGIVVVVSAGNSGDGCGSIEYAPAVYEAAFAVGATDASDIIAGFSSRGPVTADGSDRLKPDVSAPGVFVRSSVPGGGYSSYSGTSMAGPHVVGVVALLLDARPDLIGRVDEVEALLRASAFPLTSSQDCDGLSGDLVPNPVYGHGRVDALEMLVGDADLDGTDNLGDCAPVDPSAWLPPADVTDLRLALQGPEVILSWSEPAQHGGDAPPLYDVLRSPTPDEFAAASCVETGTAQLQATDGSPAASASFYLVRARNSCAGTLGSTSSGTGRIGTDCP